jgi:hypothetical protein
MRNAIKALGLVLLGVVLKLLLDPVLGPVLGPALPTAGGFIQSTMTRTNEALFTTAIRSPPRGIASRATSCSLACHWCWGPV